MAKKVLMTRQGYHELEKELATLKSEKVSQIAEKLKVARGFGDLSENSEYDEAKNEQAIVMSRIMTIEEQLNNAQIVDTDDIPKDVVSVGCTVKILDKAYNEELTYRLISSVEVGSDMDSITDVSPVGMAILGRRVGEEAEVHAPNGSFNVKILEIKV